MNRNKINERYFIFNKSIIINKVRNTTRENRNRERGKEEKRER